MKKTSGLIKTLIRSPKGTGRREVDVNHIEIPDLWHVAMTCKDMGMEKAADDILDTWHLAHDMRGALQGNPENYK